MAKDFYTFEEMEEALKNGQATRGSSGRGLAPTASQRPTQTQHAQDVPDMISFEEADSIRESQGLPRIDQGMSSMSSSLPIQIGQPKQKWWEKAIESTKNSVKTTLGALTAPARLAASVAKPALETAVQFPRAFASGAAGLMGNEEVAQSLAKPVNVPGLGEVKPLSAVPGEASPLQMAGQAAEIASLGAGATGASAVAKTAGKGAMKQAVLEGAVVGAESGALSGFGQKAQEEGSTALDAAKSAITGAVVGGTLGGVAGGIGARMSEPAKAVAKEKKLTKLVMPELSKAEKATAVASGKATEKGILRSTEILPTNRERDMVNAVRDVVDTDDSIVNNVNRLREANRAEADALKQSVSQSKAIYNPNELKKALRSVEKPPMLIADAKQASLYKQAEDKFLQFAKEEGGTPSGLLEARKKFDNWIEDNIPKIWEEQGMRPLHRALRDMRTSANNFLAERLPDVAFKDSLKKQSLIYEAIDNMSDKAAKDIGTNVVQRITKKYPNAKKVGAALGTGAAGVAGGYLVGKD